jgi:hypothetical protein
VTTLILYVAKGRDKVINTVFVGEPGADICSHFFPNSTKYVYYLLRRRYKILHQSYIHQGNTNTTGRVVT